MIPSLVSKLHSLEAGWEAPWRSLGLEKSLWQCLWEEWRGEVGRRGEAVGSS